MSVLDSNLPIFYLLPSRTSPTTESTIAQSQHDSTPAPKYLKRRDPSLTDTYSITLLDAHYPDILYASLFAPAIYPPPPSTTTKPRKNSSSSPDPPDPPKVPAQLTLGLYNPDSKVVLTQKPSSWGSGPYWEFHLPKTSFLQPTGSRLDHELGAAGKSLAAQPVVTFRWRKEGGVLSRASLRCSLIHESNVLLPDDGGTSVIPDSSLNPPGNSGKRKASNSGGAREPDMTVAIFTNGLSGGKGTGKGEVTVFEPNLKRVEVEDLKGLEVTLVMTAMAIADVYFGDMRAGFNLGPRAPAGFSGPGRTATLSALQQAQFQAESTKTGLTVPGAAGSSSSNPSAIRGGSAVNGSATGNGSTSASKDDVPPPYAGGPPPGFTPDTKVRPTQEQLFDPTYQQRLHDEERRKKEAAERAEREAREAAARKRREMVERARLAEQEAEARRLQQQFEAEAKREQERVEAETRRLRAEWERERADLERRQGGGRRRFAALTGVNGRPQTQPGASARPQQHYYHPTQPPHPHQQQMHQRPPAVTVIPPRPGPHAHNGSVSYPPAPPPRPQNLSPPQEQPKKSSWFGGNSGGKTLDQSKSRRRSFMGLRIFGDSGNNTTSPVKEKGKGKLAKKKSGMW